eukprot:jgi/Psemu1/252115/estExt_Genewise1Plus.C_410089
MQADELVSLIKEAADDPSVVSMYGVFGNGGTISTGGWAHLEEIRNALELFAKPSSSSSSSLRQKSMQEYYLASVFQHIHLQPQGDLNLYGLHGTNVFIRDFLRKYGINVHVWKHGAYKNMANIFTHSSYSKEHFENTAGILLPIHKHVCKAIYKSRHEQLGKYGYDFDQFWSMIENAGSLPADVAQQIGFVDHLPLKNPLDALLKNNKQENGEGGGASSDTDRSSTSTDATTAAATQGKKIAVIKINGAIGETAARKAEKALRQLKERKDVKCVVLRVDSPGGSINACESIYQEIEDIPQKVVVSFGNVSASGGYYISSNAERIFALPSTVTGSIGVVMLRMDFKGLAKRYGITFDSIPTSALSGSNDPFFPLNKQMDENYANQADRSYNRFKSIVSHGRNLSMKAVEKIAKGRVWTGEQAHRVGLVDELGGLDQAVDYAQQNYTTSGNAKVVNWPPKKSFWDLLAVLGSGEDNVDNLDDFDLPDSFHVALSVLVNATSSWVPVLQKSGIGTSFPMLGNEFFAAPSIPVTSGVMLTVDENAGIQCVLEDANITKAMFPSDDGTNGVL